MSKLKNAIQEGLQDVADGKVQTFNIEDIKSYCHAHSKQKKKFPRNVLNFLSKLPDLISDQWYYLTCLFYHKYNVVKIKTLPPTWNDRDSVLKHAMFQIFCDFIEEEKPFDHFAYNHESEISRSKDEEKIMWIERDAQRKAAKAEMQDIYNYWKRVRPTFYDEIESLYSDKNINSQKVHELEEKLRSLDEDSMIRIVKIRHELWT